MLNKQDFCKINETELGNSQALFRDPALSGKYEETNYEPTGQKSDSHQVRHKCYLKQSDLLNDCNN